MSARVAAAVAALLAGCAASGVRPDELDTAGHRSEAARQERLAADSEARAEAFEAQGRAGYGSAPAHARSPAQHERALAAAYRAHARAHAEAAAALERFADQACEGVEPAERGACPLIGPVQGLIALPAGVRIRLADPEREDALLARMRCHAAFARAHRDRVADCPLYVPGLDVEPGPVPGTVDLLAPDEASAQELQRRVRALLPDVGR